jgi:23S rRNA (cytidine1920-2'-O)/16S rRNA (cytidine1409-2'-O)-methyltransferase
MVRQPRVRADELLLRQGLAASRTQAKVLILAGDVRSGDRLIHKPAELLDPATVLEVDRGPKYVSRGGLKLEAALDVFQVDVRGHIAADLGASTGGFTDCLLQRDAARVYAVDVGYGQLDYRLRQDARVVVMERVNARYLEALPEPVDLVTIDTSFISLRHILPAAMRIGKPDALLIALIKPQFEAGRDIVGRRGVVTDERVREHVVRDIFEFASGLDLKPAGLLRSPVLGPAGNEEFLALFTRAHGSSTDDVEGMLASVFGS